MPLLNDVIHKRKTKRTPIWLMRQAGRYLPEYRDIRRKKTNFLDLCYSPKEACEVTLQPLARFDLDAAIIFSDILVVPHALGCDVRFEEGEGPRLSPITTDASLSTLHLERMEGKLGDVYEAIQRVASKLDKEKALIGFVGAPWTLACYMVEGKTSRDYTAARRLAFTHPVFFQSLMDILIEATALHLKAQARAGATTLKIFDSWAGILPEREFRRWVMEPTRRLVEKVRETIDEDIPIIGFPRGAAWYYRDYVEHTGVDAIALDSQVPLSWAAKELQTLVPVQGNLDNLLLACNKKSMLEATQRIMDALSRKPFIFNLGHGVLPETPIDHIETMIHQVRTWTP